ncbi:hypothetical protein P9384_02690 [Bacillus pumilus]|uniref:hypothetical protein n=1 Tax=Bacillus TaxID=1386 RepID=UPI000D02B82A|nr:hypothetical protein [Bacillus pumilus]MCY7500727.1 hypothetical protein [Bacillus pumilus]MCY7526487.1 hypothetical protein [Bacillus pumilus]MED4439010.1 hypothetical protein [Bacillus pumilus]MED4491403.1 hypothetical protein [Bacillus pumilus]MED4628053.1 hypothetical protein [Bacillus pumilus]
MSNINSKQRRENLLSELTRIGYLASLDKNPENLSLYELEMLVISFKSQRGNRVITYNARMEASE